MKLCHTCGEEFSDKFVFCPVDGSALGSAPEPSVVTELSPALEERSAVVASAARVEAGPAGGNGSSAPRRDQPSRPADETVPSRPASAPREEYHLTMLQDEGVTRRLMRELRSVSTDYDLSWAELKRDPAGFTKRMFVGYGTMLRRFFAQPYVAMATLAGVLGMSILVTALVFPYKDVYKWFASDGKLVADIGMTLDEVKTNSTLKLGAGAPVAGAEGEESKLAFAGQGLAFDFNLRGTEQTFEWCRDYEVVVGTEGDQRVKEISVVLADEPQTWKELALSVRTIDEALDDKGWRAFNEEEEEEARVFQTAALKTKAAEAPETVQRTENAIKWINRDADRLITLTALPVPGDGPQGTRYNARLKIEELRREELMAMVNEIPEEQEKPDEGPAGMAKGKGGGMKPKQEKPGGGGGGGRQETKPASFGKLPPGSLAPQIVPPDPRPPTIKNPSLPVTPTLDADPVLFPPDNRPIPYGDPKSKSTETSSGPGTGGGIGTGTGGGVGSGEGGGSSGTLGATGTSGAPAA